MKLFVTSLVLGLASLSIAQTSAPTHVVPPDCQASPTPWYSCVVNQAKATCPGADKDCLCSSASALVGCYHKYCPGFHAPSAATNFCNVENETGSVAASPAPAPGPTTFPKEPASSHASATATPKSPAESGTAKDTGANSSPSAQQSSGTAGGASGATSSPSASASGKPSAGDRSMTISGGLWTVAIAAFGAIVYRL